MCTRKAARPMPRAVTAARSPDGERPRGGGSGVQQEADDPCLTEELERDVVRLGRDERAPAQPPVGQLERPHPGAAGRVVREGLPLLVPPAPAVARVDAP